MQAEGAMRFAKYVWILIVAFALAAAPQQPKKGGGKGAPKTAAAATTGLVDINSASEKELKDLPGIGDAYAAKIIAGRPYRGKNQLIQKKIIPESTYDKIKDQIVAKQPGGKKK